MEIRIRATGQVMTEQEFRSMYSNTSFPSIINSDILDSFGADVVFEGPQPQLTRYQSSYRDGVQQLGGKWYTKWVVVDMDQSAKDAIDSQQAAAVRSTRNQMLRESDWTQLYDATGQTRTAYIQYRQSLRDLPSQPGFPWTVNWPTQP